ncbi:flagellar biosynthesis protein FlgH [Meridianimarinicoccus roseus]|jgi:flagellar L-ring protein precursor FlgH|uniref:Flagellar L-ring protein n=1 Tax=Meridianimarinicoccus roseus TaxID=2072018 RepID=A0A2V2LB03_9RHOB|nr:flagellar basal body L-ring protein FlgH [Meridianimarinicoccus roseus]PWR02568.1 flagellar biosynthesis protein FlgH [Meridianimarinicoccus roseus]
MRLRAWIILPLGLAACSTYVEERASDAYAPVYPAEELQTRGSLPTGAIYGGGSMGLFATDRRAAQVGDILTVDLDERFAAKKSQAASSSKTDDFNLNIPTGLRTGINNSDISGGTDQAFDGQGSASQSNSLSGRMSVAVVRQLPGGNLEILGQKKLTLNNGDEYIRLSGVVRQADISADNVVQSERIAHADIKYIGAGQIADAGKQGWLRRAANTLSPF